LLRALQFLGDGVDYELKTQDGGILFITYYIAYIYYSCVKKTHYEGR